MPSNPLQWIKLKVKVRKMNLYYEKEKKHSVCYLIEGKLNGDVLTEDTTLGLSRVDC